MPMPRRFETILRPQLDSRRRQTKFLTVYVDHSATASRSALGDAMQSGRVVLGLLLAAACSQGSAAAAATCSAGQLRTIAGKITSVVVREELHWSIFLNRQSTDCALSVVVLDAQQLPPACRPRSNVTASGI